MRVPPDAHTSMPWRIHAIAPDFRLEDVWQFPGGDGPEDMARIAELVAAYDPAHSSSAAVRLLFAARWRIGAVFGWDDPGTGIGSRVPTLADRVPTDLRRNPGPTFAALPFTPLYLTTDEFAAEIANRTMHGVMHLGRVPDATGGSRVQMAVLVKTNGLFGDAYMAAIKPFRYLLVYPAILREAQQIWERDRRTAVSAGPTSAP